MRLPSVLALLAGALCISAQTLDLRSYRDETYAVKATLGTATKDTSTQELYLSVDAFGSEVVVAGVDCWQCCAKTRYDASLSKATCTALPDAPDGTKADACTDAIQGGTISNGAASITEATSVPPGSPFLSLPSDGVLGLSADVHGFYFARTCSNDVQKGGTVTLNGWDTTNCATVAPATLTTLTLTPSTDAFKVLSTALTKYNVDADVPAPTGGWLATFNTVSPNVTIPKVEFDKLNAKYWKAQADNTFDCNTLKSIPAATTIKLTFSPAGTPPVAPTLSFDLQQLVFQTDDGKCALRLNAQTEDAKQNYWEFGLPLFRTYCSLVDVKNTAKTIKFAVPKVAANAACTYSKLAVLPACNAPQTTTTTTTQTAPTVSPNATQSPSQTTTPKGASRGQVMSVFSLFVMFALSALF